MDVLGLDGNAAPMVKGPVDARNVALVEFSKSYAAMRSPCKAALLKALESHDDEDSEIQFVVFSLDQPYPHGEADEELGMASISLKKLLRSRLLMRLKLFQSLMPLPTIPSGPLMQRQQTRI